MTSVIVFGPTGKIGSVVARTAQELGARVFLAMRDVQKTVPGLSSEQELDRGFERVQADLMAPDTVEAAVRASGAKRAFIYLAFGSKDNMKGTLEALKSGGVEFVVFLSSWMIPGEPADVAPTEMIPYVHAQVEISLDQVFGRENYVAVRPGFFATNLLAYKADILAGEARLPGPALEVDAITAEDMGRVSGTILVQGPRDGQHRVYLYGPQLISCGDAATAIAKTIGKEIKITALSKQEAEDDMMAHGTPKPFAEYLVRIYHGGPEEMLALRQCYDEGVKNVELYAGRPGIKFEKWLEESKGLFSA